jgi:hypothetical protein
MLLLGRDSGNTDAPDQSLILQRPHAVKAA